MSNYNLFCRGIRNSIPALSVLLLCSNIYSQEWKYLHPRLIDRISENNFSPPSHFSWDPESLFTAAVSYSTEGLIDEAMDYVLASVEKDVPPDRYLAGPRGFLSNLTESQAFQDWIGPMNIQLIHGPMLGLVTHNSASVWVRTWEEVPIQLLVVEQGGVDTIKSAIVNTSAAEDYSAIATVEGLKFDTEYDYFVSVDGKIEEGDRSLHTYPWAGQRTQFSIGFSGGMAFAPHDGDVAGKVGDIANNLERMWDTVATHDDMLAFFMLGDNVYIDHPQSPDVQDYCYYARQSRPEYKNFVAGFSILSIWDDHDFGTNDSEGGREIASPNWKIPVWEKYKHNWINPSYGGGEDLPGVWFKHTIDRVDFFFLDGRYYRTRSDGTILGPAQKQWLKDELLASNGFFKVIISPVPWALDTKPGSQDTWDGYDDERNEIFDFIADNNLDGVFLLSADRHRGDHYAINRNNNYDLHEFSLSKLTNFHTHPVLNNNPQLVFGVNQKQFFGKLDFDLAPDDPTVTMSIHNIDNEEVYSVTLNRTDMMNDPGPVDTKPEPLRENLRLNVELPGNKTVPLYLSGECIASGCPQIELGIFNTQGRQIAIKDLSPYLRNSQSRVSLGNLTGKELEPGIYFFKVTGKQEHKVQKVTFVP